ncbi:MAG: GNAT family N-acetyltransferase [Eubacterium sp.]
MRFEKMKDTNLKEAAVLFTKAFNTSPWNDHFTCERSEKRLSMMLDGKSADGMVAFDEEDHMVGMLVGLYECDDEHLVFMIREFCVDAEKKGQGIGTKLLNAMTDYLKKKDVEEMILLTLRTDETEGYYKHLGYKNVEKMVMMHKKI